MNNKEELKVIKKDMRYELQTEYDRICDLLIVCYIKENKNGFTEYLWRKYEIERIATIIDIELYRFRDTKTLIELANQIRTEPSMTGVDKINTTKKVFKDLEILEILKKHIELTPYRTISGFRDAGLNDDEYNKVKEWLENEKIN